MVFYKVCIGYRKGIMYFRRYSIGTVTMYLCMCVCVICACALPNQWRATVPDNHCSLMNGRSQLCIY